MTNYKQRVEKVIDFIGENLDQDLSLETLSGVACFSKHHFHRLFTAHTGLSLKQYVKWLRLRRAARQLIVGQDSSIINIAMDAGFESHEAFSRAFKQECGKTPSEFRADLHWHTWDTFPYLSPQEGKKMIDVTIKEKTSRRLAVFEHKGDPKKMGNAVNKLISWSKAQPIKIELKSKEAFGFGYADPRDVPAEDFKFDLAITVPDNFKVEGAIERELPAGRYAVAMHKGSRDNMGDTLVAMLREWLPESNEELADMPCIFCYHNFDHETAETALRTEVWLLLK